MKVTGTPSRTNYEVVLNDKEARALAVLIGNTSQNARQAAVIEGSSHATFTPDHNRTISNMFSDLSEIYTAENEEQKNA